MSVINGVQNDPILILVVQMSQAEYIKECTNWYDWSHSTEMYFAPIKSMEIAMFILATLH